MFIIQRSFPFLGILSFYCGMFFLPSLASAEDVESLIQKLNSPQRSERVNAEKSLIASGKKGLKEIEKQIELESEFSFQLQKIADTIRDNIASDSLLGTRISIGGNQSFTMQQMVEGIVEQTDFQVRVVDEFKQTPVTIPAQEIPFWKGIDLLGKEVGIGWQVQNKEIIFDPTFELLTGATTYPKSLRVEAVESRLKQSLLRINFRVDVEPEITPYFLKIRDQDFRLIDKVSSPMNLIPPFNRDAVREITVSNQSGFKFYVDFKSDDVIDTNSLTLNGKVEIVCAAQVREATSSLDNDEQIDPQVAVLKYEQTRNLLKLLARVKLPEELASFDSHRITLLHNEVWLSLKEDQRIAPVSKRIVQSVGGIHDVEFIFKVDEKLTPDVRFIYAYPNNVTTLSADFEVHGIAYNPAQ
jgi:hypothetical protein